MGCGCAKNKAKSGTAAGMEVQWWVGDQKAESLAAARQLSAETGVGVTRVWAPAGT